LSGDGGVPLRKEKIDIAAKSGHTAQLAKKSFGHEERIWSLWDGRAVTGGVGSEASRQSGSRPRIFNKLSSERELIGINEGFLRRWSSSGPNVLEGKKRQLGQALREAGNLGSGKSARKEMRRVSSPPRAEHCAEFSAGHALGRAVVGSCTKGLLTVTEGTRLGGIRRIGNRTGFNEGDF